MKIYNTIFFLTIFAFTGSSYAQPQQTVEGANKFFAQIVADGLVNVWSYVDKVPMKERFVAKERAWFKGHVEVQREIREITVSYEAKVLAIPSQDGCLWRVDVPIPDSLKERSNTEWGHPNSDFRLETISTAEYIPRVKMMIDWGIVTIGRDARQSAIRIRVNNAKYGYGLLTFKADAEMLDRIEYAAKFLQMSCDKTAATGF